MNPAMGGATRRTNLADITNTVASPSKRGRPDFDDQENPKAAPLIDPKSHIAQLIKENNALLMHLGERNKIIELGSIELQRLRSTLQKARQQNLHLTWANHQILAKLNKCKTRKKALKHELGCTGALLKSKIMELEEERLKAGAKEQMKGNDVDANVREPNKKQRASRNQSLNSAALANQVELMEKNGRRRKSSRRAAMDLSSELDERVEETEKAKFPMIREAVHENGRREEQNHESKRELVGRPVRNAARRVSSYKELSLNIKMRRPE